MEKAYAEKWGENVYIKLETGGEALIPLSEICEIAERFNLDIEGYEC